MSFSNNLETTGRTEIGLQFDLSSVDPLLKVGATRAIFHLSGNIPDSIDRL